MYDAAFPPATPPPWDAVAAYIGGDTPHVWTDAEWNAQPARWRLPIWTRSNPGDASEGTDEGTQAAKAALALGMPATGCAIALDYETAQDDAYLTAFDASVAAAGYRTLLYGSLSTVFGNSAPSAGYWVAHYTGVAHMESGSVATQYADAGLLGTDYDASLVADSLVLWDTRPPVTSPAPDSEEDMITSSNTGGRAGLSWSAGSKHVVQVGYNPAGVNLALDIQLVQTTGPWYSADNGGPWKPANGTGTWPIPANLIANCRGVILSWSSGSTQVPFDVYAE